MKNLISVAVLVCAGFLLYTFFIKGDSPVYTAYESFANALDAAEFHLARQMTTGSLDTLDAIKKREGWWRMFGNLTVSHAIRSVEAENITDDRAHFTVSQNTFTVPSLTPPALPDFQIVQDVTLVKVEGVWRVQEFEEQIKPLSKQGEL